jgi:hypothetical protein
MTACTHLSLPGTVAGNTPNASLSTLNPIYKNMLVTCEETGGIFIKDVTYKRNSDNTQWITISGGKHLHDVDTDPAGGSLTDIMIANQLKLFNINDNFNANVNNFHKEGTATAVNEIDTTGNRIKIDTGASTGTFGHLSRGGVKLSFAQPSQFVFKGNVAYTSGLGNVTAYIGVGLAAVNESTNQLQYGIQVCDSSSTDRNWEMVNGNGTSKGTSTSPTEPVKQNAGPRSYRMLYTPGLNTKFWANNSLQGTNTNGMVASGSSSGVRNISIGVRTNTTAVRQLYCYGVSLIGTASDTLWV